MRLNCDSDLGRGVLHGVELAVVLTTPIGTLVRAFYGDVSEEQVIKSTLLAMNEAVGWAQ